MANLLPLVVAPILPFNDLHGAAGLLGAWVHRGDPAARIDEYFSFHVHPAPNVIYWAVGWLLTRALSVNAATNLYIAIFCVVALPVSLLVALRALGKPPVLSFLAFPLIYHRCLWYGFMGSVPAVPMLLLVIAFASGAFSRRRGSWRDVALAATLFALSTAHAFLYLVALGMVALWALLAVRQPSPPWRRLAVVAPSLGYLGPWIAATLFGRASDGTGFAGLLRHLWRQRPPFASYLRNAHDWLIDGYAGSIDEWVAVTFLVTLVALLGAGVRTPGAGPTKASPPTPSPGLGLGRAPGRGRLTGRAGGSDRVWSSRVLVMAGVLGAGYFLLPMTITRPFGWWAVHVRLLVPFLLVVALAIPVRRRGLPGPVVIPAMVAAIVYGSFMAVDFKTWWMDTELAGFAGALDAIPAGQRVHAIYPPFDGERHYSHFPMGYIVDYYVVARGGTAAPIMSGHPGELWINWRHQRPGPPWGMAPAFNWAAHAPGWDYFLAKQPAPGNGPRLALFARVPPGAVTKVYERGLWSVWKRER